VHVFVWSAKRKAADEGKKCKRAKFDAWQGRWPDTPAIVLSRPLNDVRYVRIIDF